MKKFHLMLYGKHMKLLVMKHELFSKKNIRNETKIISNEHKLLVMKHKLLLYIDL